MGNATCRVFSAGIRATGMAVEGAAQGFAIGFTRGFVESGSFDGALSAGLNGAKGGAMLGGALGAVRGLLRPTVCFAEGTLVVTGVNEDGSYQLTPIEELEEGDLVYSRDQYNEANDAGMHTIVELFRNVSDHLRIIEVRDANGNVETIRTTEEHPFYLSGPGGGWVAAKDLQPGQRLSEADGTNDAVVLTSTREEHPSGVAVNNFEGRARHSPAVSHLDDFICRPLAATRRRHRWSGGGNAASQARAMARQ